MVDLSGTQSPASSRLDDLPLPLSVADIPLGNLAPGNYELSFLALLPNNTPELNLENNLLTLGFSVLESAADSDGDTLPDDYEVSVGLDPNLQSDAFLDSDEDGFPNWLEFRSGLDIRNPESRIRVSFSRADNSTTVTITPTALDVSYQVHSSSNLMNFAPIPGASFTSAIPEESRSITLPPNIATEQFYSIEITGNGLPSPSDGS